MPKTLEEYTKDELIEVIKNLKRRKKFGLVWEDKAEEVVRQVKTELPVIEEVASRAIDKVKDAATNFIIEGDNYHSLSALNYTHTGKVDIVYIDPPYNTGNKDFIYEDRYVDRDDTFRHSTWLSFMSKRLVLAKQLLKQTGILFISIDENEYAHLKILCDQLFGENNFVNSFVWVNNLKGRQISGLGAAGTHEYVLAYAKNASSVSQFEGSAQFLKSIMPSTYKGFDYKTKTDEYGDYVIKNELYNSNSIFNESTRPNLVFDIYYNPKTGNVLCEDVSDSNLHDGYIKISPKQNNSGRAKYHAWRWSRNKVLNEKYNLEFAKTPSGYKVYTKVRTLDRTIVKDVITDINTSTGTQDIKDIFAKGTFDFPKPVDLIKFIISLNNDKEALVLDFFAGSGTTGHAVLELNEDDGGNRSFILCTNNENGIAENITYERIKKVISGYGSSKHIPANLRYFKTALVSKQQTDDQTRIELVARSTDMICLREDAFEKVIDTKLFRVFGNADHYAAIVFEPEAIVLLKDALAKLKDDKPIHIYVFSLSNDTYESDFADLEREHELRPIPESILEVYRRIHKAQGEELGL